MRRLILHFVGIAAMVTLVASAIARIAFDGHRGEIGVYVNRYNIGFTTERGNLMPLVVVNSTARVDVSWWALREKSGADTYAQYFSHRRLGFGFGFDAQPGSTHAFYMLSVPYWFLILVSTGALIGYLRRVRRRPKAGCCEQCGYDLRGSADSAVCPECGEAISGAIANDAS